MAGHLKLIFGASMGVGLALSTPFAALADGNKKAAGDDFSETLKDRFPKEAKRGTESIFRSVSDSETGDTVKGEATKEAGAGASSTETKAEASKKEEKPKLMLADLFKGKPKPEAKDEPVKVKEKPEPDVKKEPVKKKETSKVMLADLFKGKPKPEAKDEPVKVEEKPEEKPEPDVKKEASSKKETSKVMLADLFKGKPKNKEKTEADAADKKETAVEQKPEPRVAKEKSKDEEKPKFMLADLFKGKSKKDEEEKMDVALKDVAENADSDSETKEKPAPEKQVKPVVVNEPTESKPTVATTSPEKSEEKDEPSDNEKDKAGEKEKEKSTGWASNSKLFGKKSARVVTPVIPEDSITNQPAPKIEFSKVDTSKDLGEGGDFKSWDDLPYKRKSTVDRMMGKLNIKQAPSGPATGLPRPQLPGGPSKPAAKPE